MSNFQSYTSYIPLEDEVYTAGPQLRVEAPVHRTSSLDGVMSNSSEGDHARGHSGQINPHADTNTWQATARTTTGRAVSEITPDTLVEFDGVQAKVSFWVGEGRLSKGADGSFNATSAPQAAPEATNGDYVMVPDHAMAQVNQLLEPLPQSALDSIVAHTAGVVAGKLSNASLVAKFATLSGIPLADAGQRLTVINAVYQAQTDQALQDRHSIGAADKADFFQWCRTNKPGQMKDAFQRQMHGSDVSGWAPLANQWLAINPPSMEAIKATGRIPVRGQEIFIEGQWMSPKAAARAGLI
jgi:hypothetical protein